MKWRRLLRFSFASLLIAITFICVWLARLKNQVDLQREVVATVENYGGTVTYDNDPVPFGSALFVREPTLVDSLLERFVGFDYAHSVSRLHIKNGSRTDQLVEKATRLWNLQSLHIWDSDLSDVGLRNISHCKHLSELHLECTDITDKSLGRVAKLTSLRSLGVCRNVLVTQNGLERLYELQDLEKLYLDDQTVGSMVLRKLQTLSVGDSKALSRFDGLESVMALVVSRAHDDEHFLANVFRCEKLQTLLVVSGTMKDTEIEELKSWRPKLQVTAQVINTRLARERAETRLWGLFHSDSLDEAP